MLFIAKYALVVTNVLCDSQIYIHDIGCTEPMLGLPMSLLAGFMHRYCGPSQQHPKSCNVVSIG